MTTFAREQYLSSTDGVDPATVSITPGASNRLLVAVLNERSGTGSTSHTVTDGEGGWTVRLRHDQQLADSNARHSFSVWTKVTTSTTALTVSGDDGTGNGKRLTVAEYSSDDAAAWSFLDVVSADTGTGSTSPLSIGPTDSIPAGDILVIGIGCWRNQTNNPAAQAFSGGFGAASSFNGATSGRSHSTAFQQTAGGTTYSTDLSWTGTGHEAAGAILVMAHTGDPPPTITDQPDNQSVSEGNQATFGLTATGDISGYQWQLRDPDAPTSGSVDFPRAGSDDYVYRATPFNYNAAYTAFAYVRLNADPNDFQHFISIAGAFGYEGNTDFLGVDSDGVTYRWGCAGGSSDVFSTGSALSLGAWYWVALVRESATSLKVYIGTDENDGTLVATITSDVSARDAAAYVILGGYSGLNLDGNVSKPRFWTRALTLSELQAEAASVTVADDTDLWAAPAFEGADMAAALNDTSANNRDFTAGSANPSASPDGPINGVYADWTNVDTGTGGTTDTYTTPATTLAMDGYQYRCNVTGIGGTTTSNTAALTVTAGGGDGTADGVTITAAASLIPGAATGERSPTQAGQTLVAAASFIPGAATGQTNATAGGQTLSAAASLIAGAATGDASADGQTLIAAASLIDGDATGDASAQGQTLIAAASIVPGEATSGAVAAGQIMTAAASLIDGDAFAGVGGDAAGATFTAAASIIGGDATATRAPTAVGATMVAAASLVGGDASAVRSPTVAGATIVAAASLVAGSAGGGADSTANGVTLTAAASLAAGAADGEVVAVAAGVLLTASGSVIPGAADGVRNVTAEAAFFEAIASFTAGLAGAFSNDPSAFFTMVPAGEYESNVPGENYGVDVLGTDNDYTAHV